MPIQVTLDEVMARRGMTLTQLSEAVDITLANLSILKTGKGKAIRFSTMEAICQVLDCQPGDILSFVSEDVSLWTARNPLEARWANFPFSG